MLLKIIPSFDTAGVNQKYMQQQYLYILCKLCAEVLLLLSE